MPSDGWLRSNETGQPVDLKFEVAGGKAMLTVEDEPFQRRQVRMFDLHAAEHVLSSVLGRMVAGRGMVQLDDLALELPVAGVILSLDREPGGVKYRLEVEPEDAEAFFQGALGEVVASLREAGIDGAKN